MSGPFPGPGSPDSVDSSPDTGSLDYVAEWRIRAPLWGGTYCIPVDADGSPTDDELLEALAVEIDENYLSGCTVEFRRMDSDEPWTLLGGSDEQATRLPFAVFEHALEALEELIADGVVFSAEQTARLALVLTRGQSDEA